MRDAADRAVVPRFRTLESHAITEKSPGDWVTDADHECEDLLTAALQVIEPGTPGGRGGGRRSRPVAADRCRTATSEPGCSTRSTARRRSSTAVRTSPRWWHWSTVASRQRRGSGSPSTARCSPPSTARARPGTTVPSTHRPTRGRSAQWHGLLRTHAMPESLRSASNAGLERAGLRHTQVAAAGVTYPKAVTGEFAYALYWRTLPVGPRPRDAPRRGGRSHRPAPRWEAVPPVRRGPGAADGGHRGGLGDRAGSPPRTTSNTDRGKDSSSDRGLPNYTIVITSPGTARAWSLLRAGVPLSLLCDLAEPDGPPSREIYTAEVVADDVTVTSRCPPGRPIDRAAGGFDLLGMSLRQRRTVAAALLAVASGLALLGAAPASGTALGSSGPSGREGAATVARPVAGCSVFPRNNYWNADISAPSATSPAATRGCGTCHRARRCIPTSGARSVRSRCPTASRSPSSEAGTVAST